MTSPTPQQSQVGGQDGGPAFPCEVGFGCAAANEHQTGGTTAMQYGMSLRDHFAGLAMAAHITRHPLTRHPVDADGVDFPFDDTMAEWAYAQADAMLHARHAQAAAPGVQGEPKPAPLTLTGHQIAELAKFAGDDPEAEVSVQHRSAFTSDEGEKMPSGLYCWATDYPEEGCIPLERLPDCSMNPSSCPRNEGHGCDCGMGASPSLPSQEGQHG